MLSSCARAPAAILEAQRPAGSSCIHCSYPVVVVVVSPLSRAHGSWCPRSRSATDRPRRRARRLALEAAAAPSATAAAHRDIASQCRERRQRHPAARRRRCSAGVPISSHTPALLARFVMSSGLGVQDGAPSGVLHLSRSSSSVPSFSRVVHGDLAQCVAHCLFVHELARLARVSRDCLAHVQKKMEQFKAIDLTSDRTREGRKRPTPEVQKRVGPVVQ